MTHTPINPELLTWARERIALDPLALAGHFSKLISGELRIADAEQFLERVESRPTTNTTRSAQ